MKYIESLPSNCAIAKLMLMKVIAKLRQGVDITEVYSPERIVKEAKRFGLSPGLSMDLLTGWNFDLRKDRMKAEEHQKEARPLLLVGSPMCTLFNVLQNLSGWDEREMAWYENSVAHMKWICQMYEEQMKMGAYFLHEHPVGATSWHLPCVRRLREMKGVYSVTVDQCMFGLAVKSRSGKGEGLGTSLL